MNTIINQIQKIIAQKIEIPDSKIHRHAHLINDLNIDSLDMIEIIMSIEEKFDINLPDDIIDTFKTIDCIAKYIKNMKNSN